MIAYLSGTVLQILDRSIVIDTGNIGYEAYISETLREQLKPKDEIELFTYTHVREDALDIFGFTTQKELNFFKQLISISGVGPKTAQDILSLPIDKLKNEGFMIPHIEPQIEKILSIYGAERNPL